MKDEPLAERDEMLELNGDTSYSIVCENDRSMRRILAHLNFLSNTFISLSLRPGRGYSKNTCLKLVERPKLATKETLKSSDPDGASADSDPTRTDKAAEFQRVKREISSMPFYGIYGLILSKEREE
jgi:hypothetical protein